MSKQHTPTKSLESDGFKSGLRRKLIEFDMADKSTDEKALEAFQTIENYISRATYEYEPPSSKYSDPKAEFDRGYNFGKEDGVRELMATIVKQGSEYMVEFETDSVVVKIPREYFQLLRIKASATA